MEEHEYEVQRKVITWERVSVMAHSFDEALERALESDGWDEVYDQSEATDDYWVKDQDTDEARTKEGYFSEWEDGI